MSQSLENTNLHTITSATQFQELLSTDLDRVSLLNFWAKWAEPCEKMNKVVVELAKKYPQLLTLQIEADVYEDIAESFEIEAICKGHNLLSRINGADAPSLTAAIATHVRQPPKGTASSDKAPEAPADAVAEPEETTEQLNDRMRKLMQQSKVVLFMKGSPDTPRCGFSRQAVALLREKNVEFSHFDILTDEKVRQGLKRLNDWPTYPQVIVNGELIGGLDVLKESIASGEFKDILAA